MNIAPLFIFGLFANHVVVTMYTTPTNAIYISLLGFIMMYYFLERGPFRWDAVSAQANDVHVNETRGRKLGPHIFIW